MVTYTKLKIRFFNSLKKFEKELLFKISKFGILKNYSVYGVLN